MRLKVRLDAIFAHAHLIFYLMTSPCPSSSLWSVSLSVLWSGMTSLMNVLQNGPWWSGTKDWWLLSHCSGPGEQGQAYIMTQEEEKKKGELYRVNGFNAFASDLISLQRALKDIRHPEYVHTCVFCEDCVWCGCVYACMCVYILYIIHVFSVKTVCGVVVCMHACVCIYYILYMYFLWRLCVVWLCACVCVCLTVSIVTFVLCIFMLVLFSQLPAEEVFEGATNSQHHPSFPQRTFLHTASIRVQCSESCSCTPRAWSHSGWWLQHQRLAL